MRFLLMMGQQRFLIERALGVVVLTALGLFFPATVFGQGGESCYAVHELPAKGSYYFLSDPQRLSIRLDDGSRHEMFLDLATDSLSRVEPSRPNSRVSIVGGTSDGVVVAEFGDEGDFRQNFFQANDGTRHLLPMIDSIEGIQKSYLYGASFVKGHQNAPQPTIVRLSKTAAGAFLAERVRLPRSVARERGMISEIDPTGTLAVFSGVGRNQIFDIRSGRVYPVRGTWGRAGVSILSPGVALVEQEICPNRKCRRALSIFTLRNGVFLKLRDFPRKLSPLHRTRAQNTLLSRSATGEVRFVDVLTGRVTRPLEQLCNPVELEGYVDFVEGPLEGQLLISAHTTDSTGANRQDRTYLLRPRPR